MSMGRRLKTRVPCHPDSLLPHTPDLTFVKKKEKEYREKVKVNNDIRHEVVAPEQLSPGDAVWIPDQKKEGWVIQNHKAPRPVLIETSDGGDLRRNRQMTRKLHQPATRPESAGAPHTPRASPEPDEVLSPSRDHPPASPYPSQGLPATQGMPASSVPQQQSLSISQEMPKQLQSTPRRSSRTRAAPKKLEDYVVNQ